MFIPPALRRNFERESNLFGRTAAASMTASTQTVLARADVVFARSLLKTTHLKGDIGEFFAGRTFLDNELSQKFRGNWFSLTPRTGRQGLDHLYMRIDSRGRLHWMVGESKYGTSQLGNLADGSQQMSPQWIRKHFSHLGEKYKQIYSAQNIDFKSAPDIASTKNYKQFEVPVNGKNCVFWRDDGDPEGVWHFSGNKNELDTAQKMALKMGNDLTSQNYHVRAGFIFRIKPEGNDLVIILDRVNTSGNSSSVGKVTNSTRMIIKDILNKNITDQELKAQIATALHKKMPHLSEKEVKNLTDDLAKKYRNGELLKNPRPVWQLVALQSLATAAIAGVIDTGIQFLSTRKIELRHTVLAAGSAGIGTASGQIINIVLLKTTVGNQVVRSVAGLLHVGSGMTRIAMSGLGGGTITTLLMAYGSLALGYGDVKQANRMAASGISGGIMGATAAIGVPSLVANFAVCGTGAQIASLHGVVATNATMAWLGGGTVASGGFGIVGGTVVLGGIVTIATIATASLVALGFALHDEKEQRRYSVLLANKLEESRAWKIIADRCSHSMLSV